MVYETFHAGAVTRIGVWNAETKAYQSVYRGTAQDITHSRIFTAKIDVSCSSYTYIYMLEHGEGKPSKHLSAIVDPNQPLGVYGSLPPESASLEIWVL